MVFIRRALDQKAALRRAVQEQTFGLNQAEHERHIGRVRKEKVRHSAVRDFPVEIRPATHEIPERKPVPSLDRDDVGTVNRDRKRPAAARMARLAGRHQSLPGQSSVNKRCNPYYRKSQPGAITGFGLTIRIG